MSAVRQRLESLSPADISVCSIVKAELFYGAMRSDNREQCDFVRCETKSALAQPAVGIAKNYI
jgi:predicted nucleic acid-binding protein